MVAKTDHNPLILLITVDIIWAILWDYGTWVWAFAGRLCDKYHNLMSWLKWEKNTYNLDGMKEEQQEQKAKRTALSQEMATRLS